MSEAETTEGAKQEAKDIGMDESDAPENDLTAPEQESVAPQEEPVAPKEELAAAPKEESGAPQAVEGSAPVKPYRPPYLFLGVVSIVTLAADLGSKYWAVNNLGPHKFHDVAPGWLRFVLAHNPGGAWGLLHEESSSIRVPFFILVSVVAIAFIVSLYRKLAPDQAALRWGLPLVLGGALGNLIDRIRYQHVIDFIDMYTLPGTTMDRAITAIPAFIRVKLFGPGVGLGYHWPTYNIADIAIVVGVVLMAVDMFQSRKAEKKAAAEKAAAQPPA